MSERKIEKTFLLIDGKKVPYYKVPAGVSGLTSEAKAELDLKSNTIIDAEEFETLEKDPQLEAEIEKYLEVGDIDDYQAQNYFGSEVPNEIEQLFDKIEY